MAGLPLGWCGSYYSQQLYPDHYYADYYKGKADDKFSDGSLWYEKKNENYAYKYMWYSSRSLKKEHAAWICTDGVFVLPLSGYDYWRKENVANSSGACSFGYYPIHCDAVDHLNREILPRWYLDGPKGLGKKEIIGAIHTHWDDNKTNREYRSWCISDADETLAKYFFTGIPIFALGYDDHFVGYYYDYKNYNSIPLSNDGILNPLQGFNTSSFIDGNKGLIKKLIPIRLRIINN